MHTKLQFKPLLQREVEICKRVAQCRYMACLTQAQMAENMEVSRNQLANLEAARVPLKIWFGLKLCSRFNLNPFWLATGEGRKYGFVNFQPEKLEALGGHDLLFSEAFFVHLLPDLQKKSLISTSPNKVAIGEYNLSVEEEKLYQLTLEITRKIPKDRRHEWLNRIEKTFQEFQAEEISSTLRKASKKPCNS